MSKSLKKKEELKRKFGHGFNFEGLPIEIKHVVFKNLKTNFLQEVCASVCQGWAGIVEDILEQRRISNEGRVLSAFFQQEMALRTRHEVSGDPLEVLKVWEGTTLSKNFDATSVEVNSDVLFSGTGLLYKLWTLRDCDCVEYSECILRRVHLLPAFNLFVLDSDSNHGNLQFYNLSELERLSMNEDASTIFSYMCPQVANWLGSNHTTNTGISVFRDTIAVEIAAKTILLLKVLDVDHKSRVVDIKRVRIIHLPLWASALCLYEKRLVVLYTTGHVGMWDAEVDELYMSTNKCDLGDPQALGFMHRTKLYRIGNLALVRTFVSRLHHWYVIDSTDPNLMINSVEITKLMDAQLLLRNSFCKTLDVFHIDMWFNCLIVHFKVELEPPESRKGTTSYLSFKQIQRYPTLQDFLDRDKFHKSFLSGIADAPPVAVLAQFRIAFTSPFIPCSLKPWQLEPSAGDPTPVADLIAVQLTPTDRSIEPPRSKLKAFRIRIANLPFKNE